MKKTIKDYEEEVVMYKKLSGLWRKLALGVLEDSKRFMIISLLLHMVWFIIGLMWGMNIVRWFG